MKTGTPRGRVLERRIAALWREVLGLRNAPSGGDNFFLLGGDSLALLKVLNRIEEDFALRLGLEDAFALATPGRMAAHLAGILRRPDAGAGEGKSFSRSVVPPPPLAPDDAAEEEGVPASAGQAGLWFLRLLHPEAPSLYNTGMEIVLQGPVDARALERALAALARRHEVLRSALRWNQRARALEQHVPTHLDFRLAAARVKRSSLPTLRRRFVNVPFVLEEPPLWRARLLSSGGGRHHLLLCLHHAVCDGWSGKIFLHELAAFYRLARGENRAPALGEPGASYGDFCRWQRAQAQGEAFARQRSYWRGRLAPGAGEAPGAHVLDGFEAGRLRFAIPARLRRDLLALARRRGLTLYMVLLAAFALLLARERDGQPPPIGTPVANRAQRRWEGLVGFFANTVVLRLDPSANGLPAFLARLRETVLAAFANAELPYAEVVRAAGHRGEEEDPLFRHFFVFHNEAPDAPDFAGLAAEVRRLKPACCHYPLTLEVMPRAKELGAEFEFHRARYSRASIRRMARDWLALLADLAAEPPVPALPGIAAQQAADPVHGGRGQE